MAELFDNTCPICGSRRGERSAAAQAGGAAPAEDVSFSENLCPNCGFRGSFVSWFASQEDFAQWRTSVAGYQKTLHTTALSLASGVQCEGRPILAVGEKSVARMFHGSQLLQSNAAPVDAEDVVQYSMGGRHTLALHRDGTVTATRFSDNDFGQSDVGQLRDITFVLAAAQCSYAVRRDGTVAVCGSSPLRKEIERWQNVSQLACGDYHVVACTKEGTLLVAVDAVSRELQEMKAQAETCSDVIRVAAARNYIVALRRDGTVAFFGKKRDPKREVEQWKDIATIDAEYQYVVGVTRQGQVVLAGQKNDLTDMGRSEAAQWKNIVAVACSRAGIGGLSLDGTLHLAGNVTGAKELCDRWNRQAKEVSQYLVSNASAALRSNEEASA